MSISRIAAYFPAEGRPAQASPLAAPVPVAAGSLQVLSGFCAVAMPEAQHPLNGGISAHEIYAAAWAAARATVFERRYRRLLPSLN